MLKSDSIDNQRQTTGIRNGEKIYKQEIRRQV